MSSKKALIVVDIQNDYFPDGLWTLSKVEAAAAKASQVIAAFRESGDLVVHIRHEFPSQDAPFFRPNSEGAQIHPSVINKQDEPVVLKHYINSFRETELKAILDQHGIEAVIIVGNMSHMCVDGITRAAVDFGYDTTVLHDACATRDLEFDGVKVPAEHVHAAFMAALRFGYAPVVSTAEYLQGR
ncbi:Isochorismatase [Stutzerimonas stutzeri]|uniref:Isochorismatase n=1 Tax=Stutzerimonas stutzeri TaxID=316 RepID=W8QXT5_STUST|nr:cysteine hydrolase family protein [Stutzerimonas stutzeri]AHL75455.1 Isochorismatase [Stutzerimonas stutzeri]MCQ4327978.1 cysteine hydrolase [Stutzerimonas stutzeri]